MNQNSVLRSLFLCLFMGGVYSLSAQQTDTTAGNLKTKKHFEPSVAVMFMPVYTAQFPFGHMADRYGFNNLFGFQLGYKFSKNWIMSGEGNFLFGTKVKDNYVLDNISTATAQFITQNNDLARINGLEQGFSLKVSVGKVVPFSTKFPDAGLLFQTGVGMVQHKIAINVRSATLPQLDKTYRKGYDRMCNGPVFSQFIGGIFMAKRKFISAYAGLQFDIAFTENRRNYDFYLMRKLSEKRIDMFLGIKIGWIIPVYIKSSENEYTY